MQLRQLLAAQIAMNRAMSGQSRDNTARVIDAQVIEMPDIRKTELETIKTMHPRKCWPP